MAKIIKLSRGESVIVDDHWYPILSRYPWHKSVKGYAQRSIVAGMTIMMHQIVAMTPKSMQTDHINGNKLDNREENLRCCTNSQNAMARTRKALPKTGFVGVSLHKEGKYQASITKEGKRKYLGLYETAEEAARVYDKAAREWHGEFAKQNFRNEE